MEKTERKPSDQKAHSNRSTDGQQEKQKKKKSKFYSEGFKPKLDTRDLFPNHHYDMTTPTPTIVINDKPPVLVQQKPKCSIDKLECALRKATIERLPHRSGDSSSEGERGLIRGPARKTTSVSPHRDRNSCAAANTTHNQKVGYEQSKTRSTTSLSSVASSLSTGSRGIETANGKRRQSLPVAIDPKVSLSRHLAVKRAQHHRSHNQQLNCDSKKPDHTPPSSHDQEGRKSSKKYEDMDKLQQFWYNLRR